MKIYMDVCCLNRPFDLQVQPRICLETEAVTAIVERCRTGKWQLAASDMIDMELEQCRSTEKRKNVQEFYSIAVNRLSVTEEVRARARSFQSDGLKLLDSLHLALAETYNQDVLLTTDDAFLSVAQRLQTAIQVSNPVSWFMEAILYDY